MDIKWKNIKYSAWMKLIAVLLCIAGVMTVGYGLLNGPYISYAIEKGDLKDSLTLSSLFTNTYYDISDNAFRYKNEEEIKKGKYLDKEELNNTKQSFIRQRDDSIEMIKSANEELISGIETDEGNAEVARLEDEKNKKIKEIQTFWNDKISSIESEKIRQQLQDYRDFLHRLNSYKGIYYHLIYNDGTTLSNIEKTSDVVGYFDSLPASSKYTKAISTFIPFENYKNISSEGSTIYIGISQSKYDELNKEYSNNRSKGLWGIYCIIAGIIVFLIGFIYLLYAAGRRPKKDEVKLLELDRIYLDIGLIGVISFISLCIYFIGLSYVSLFNKNNELFCILSAIFLILGTLPLLFYATSVAKRIKRREFLKHTLIYFILYEIIIRLKKVILELRRLIYGGPLVLRSGLLFSAYVIVLSFVVLMSISLVATFRSTIFFFFGFILFLTVNAGALIFTLKRSFQLKEISIGAERIKKGDYSIKIPETGSSEMISLANSINHIGEGLKTAVQNEVRSERMKSELITNVSHDLKTPLTSIITYVDLLKTEGLESENAPKYLDILDKKSQRLKTLTEDLFEASKAASGSIALNLEKLDIAALLKQGLGELSDKINASGLDFRVKLPEEKLEITADGKLLWRVMDNLLLNVFKYALPHSRVYIDVSNKDGSLCITIKNISAYALDVAPEELLERFKRGDESRHSEGSGLGLSIAKSLTELMGGKFSIDIDGDLFKAVVRLPYTK